MTSYGFEVAGKNAIIKTLEQKYDKKVKIQELHTVWFSYVLKNMKMIVIDLSPSQTMYEVTYNSQKKQFYVDVYNKENNQSFNEDELKPLVEKETE